MKMSYKFDKPSVVVDKIYYFPESFVHDGIGFRSDIAYKIGKWRQDYVRITAILAKQIKEYYDKHAVIKDE